MSEFDFSKTSNDRLKTCHVDLQRIFYTVIEITDIDFGIACGHRSVEEQQKLYAQGRTKVGSIVTHVDGIKKESKHNYSPSMAVDFYAFINGKASWDVNHLVYIAGMIRSVARIFKAEGKITHDIRWGGNFDKDGEILEQDFIDCPHVELI